MLFLRDTPDPQADLARGFSGMSMTWFSTREKACEWRTHHDNDCIHPIRQDPVTGFWCGNPEWGLSSLAFDDEDGFREQFRRLCGEWGAGYRPIAVFESVEFDLGCGADGEDCFRGGRLVCMVESAEDWHVVVAALAPAAPQPSR